VLDGQPGIEHRPLIAVKTFPPVNGPTVERLVGEGEDVEASLVASRIRELGCDYKDVAILVRSLNALEPLTRALDRFDIPFVITGGRTFLEAREIRDLLAFLSALVNPLDEIALVGVLRSPLVGLSDEEIFRIGKTGWQELFQTRFGHLRKRAGFLSPDRLLPIQPDLSPRARANVDKLSSWLRREHRNRPRPLAEMLDDLEYLSEPEASPPEAGNVVQLMSIHSAKGLEFKVVFVSALQRGAENTSPVLAFANGIGAKWRNPATGKSQPDTAYAVFKQERKIRDEAEENRLLYVAITRAEDRLFLTSTKARNSRGWQKLVESTVVAEFTSDTVASAPPRIERPEIEVQIVDPPVVTAQHDSTVAVTSISLFETCPRKYFLSKYIGLALPSSDAMSIGSEVHKILAGGTSNLLEAQELASRFPMPSHPTRLEHEFDFMFAVEDVVLRGQIDLWYEQDGEIVLVDFKTDRSEAPESYALQLRFYALALERYLGRLPDRAVLFYLRSGRVVEISLSLNDLKSAITTLNELLNAQETMVFPLQEGEHCFRCEFYKGLCPAGKD
jgi:CRISPR-associated protein Cas4